MTADRTLMHRKRRTTRGICTLLLLLSLLSFPVYAAEPIVVFQKVIGYRNLITTEYHDINNCLWNKGSWECSVIKDVPHKRITRVAVFGTDPFISRNKVIDAAVQYEWRIPIGDRNVKEFGYCLPYEQEKGVCHTI